MNNPHRPINIPQQQQHADLSVDVEVKIFNSAADIVGLGTYLSSGWKIVNMFQEMQPCDPEIERIANVYKYVVILIRPSSEKSIQ